MGENENVSSYLDFLSEGAKALEMHRLAGSRSTERELLYSFEHHHSGLMCL